MDLIINFTPTGMLPTKDMTPHIPVSISEIVEDVHKAMEIGITMVHLHARESDSGQPTCEAKVYAEIIEKIRLFAPELVICVSLSGRSFPRFEQRSEPLQLEGKLKPDMGSLTLSSLNFSGGASVNTPDMIRRLAIEMQSKGILPELEVFDVGMANYAKYLEAKGILQPPHYFNLMFGNIASAQADLLHVGMMLRELPSNSLWSLGGIGNAQLIMNSVGIATAGGVRVGLEDNLWFDSRRTRLATNIELIGRVHRIAEEHERQVMTPDELRKLLNLENGYGKYGRPLTNSTAPDQNKN